MTKKNDDVKDVKNDYESLFKGLVFEAQKDPDKESLAEENKRLKKENEEYLGLSPEKTADEFFPLVFLNNHLMRSVQNIERYINNHGGFQPEDILTGFEDLDKLTNGFHSGEYIVLASRPGVGKSSLALNILSNVVLRCHKRAGGEPRFAALFSLEMTANMITNRLLCAEAGINSQRLHTGEMCEKDWDSLWSACDATSKTHLYISDKPDITFEEIRNKALRLKAVKELDFLVIDSAQLLHLARWNGDYRDRTAELSEISYRLKLLARELNVPVLVLSQLSRNVEARTVKRPRLFDLRDCGSLEEDADLVLLLYREDYYDPDTENKHTELIVAKNRFGPVDVVNLFFHKQFTKFVGFTRRE